MGPSRIRFAALAALLTLPLAGAARAEDFWKWWGDGKAELDGYALTQPRYGEPREGTAVLVFVTEDFSDSARVKADPGKPSRPSSCGASAPTGCAPANHAPCRSCRRR